MPKTTKTFSLDVQQLQDLDARAKSSGVPASKLVQQAIDLLLGTAPAAPPVVDPLAIDEDSPTRSEKLTYAALQRLAARQPAGFWHMDYEIRLESEIAGIATVRQALKSLAAQGKVFQWGLGRTRARGDVGGVTILHYGEPGSETRIEGWGPYDESFPRTTWSLRSWQDEATVLMGTFGADPDAWINLRRMALAAPDLVALKALTACVFAPQLTDPQELRLRSFTELEADTAKRKAAANAKWEAKAAAEKARAAEVRRAEIAAAETMDRTPLAIDDLRAYLNKNGHGS